MDYDEIISSLVFIGESTQSVVISVIDDDLFESPETFCEWLNAAGILTPNVHLGPAKAVASLVPSPL